MPVLTVGKTVRSAKPTLLVENAFKPGAYRFQLVVVDDSGNASAPALLTVTVRGKTPGPVTTGGGPILTHIPIATPTPTPTPTPAPARPSKSPVSVTPAPSPGPVEIPIKPTRPRG